MAGDHELNFEVRLNGAAHRTTATTVLDLLEELKLQGRPIAVELNRQIVQKDHYQITAVAQGDLIEVIQFVGGG